MSDTEIAHGPIDYLIVEWPAGTQPNGEGLKELANLSDRGLIRVLDLVFVTKGEDGAVAGLALADIDADGELDLIEVERASAGLIGEDDYDDSGRVARRQQSRWAQEDQGQGQDQEQYQEPAPAAAPAADPLDQLKQLGELKASGVLTDAEFEAQKAKILQGV